MPDFVSIAYRGARYALGQAPQFYGIWHAESPESPPLEWWPLTPDGWTAAWSRFTSIEVPGSIIAVPPPVPSSGPPVAQPGASQSASPPNAAQPLRWRPPREPDRATLTRNSRISAALVGAGVLLGVIGLFPMYTDGASLGSISAEVVPHSIYLAAWALGGVLILLGGARLRAGALLGLGVSAVTLGLFIADIGQLTAGGSVHPVAGSGLVLSLLGWLACTAGVVLASVTGTSVRSALGWMRGLSGGPGAQQRRSQHSHEIVPVVTLMLAALGGAIAFAPSWDSFTLRALTGSQTVTEGNAFANPGLVIFGDVLVMVAFVAVVALAALWRPTRLGAALAAGALVPMVAQAISAIVQISGPFTPQQFGVSAGDASRLGLTIGAGLTPIFWVYCAFLGTAILLCAWMLVAPGASAYAPARPGPAAPGGVAPGGQASAEPVFVQPGAAATAGSTPPGSAESAPASQ